MTASRAVAARGLLAMAAALAVLFAVNSLFPQIPYPPARLAAILINLTPGGFATRAIESLGHGALRSLSFGVNAGMLVAGSLFAVVIERGRTPASKARLALGGATVLFVGAMSLMMFSPEGGSISATFAYALCALIFARYALGRPLLDVLMPSAREGEAPLDAISRSRRRFIVRALVVVGGLSAGGLIFAKSAVKRVTTALRIAEADLPFVAPPEDPEFPRVNGLTSEITSNTEFYNVDINIVKPSVDVEKWTLRVHGLVARPLDLDYRELQESFEVVELAHTLTCISNEVGGDLISTAVWRGVRLKDVLQRAGLKDGIVDLVFRGAEGYSDSIPLAKALEETTLVVFGMNGVALPREHGFPARIIVPGIYGMKNVKWLTEIEAVDHDYQGYWMIRGWSDEALIKTGSRIDVPFDTAKVTEDDFVAGVAWAGDRGISAVEVSDDGGASWRPAAVKRELSRVSWRQWVVGVGERKGKRKVMVRAVDGRGHLQTARVTKPHPDGASGYDSTVFEVE